MRFDLFWILDNYPDEGESPGAVLARVLGETRLAEDLGFEGCWYAEHHFTPYGACPSPPVLLGAAAVLTKRVRLGAAVGVLPLSGPIRQAEDYAMVDLLSGGRLDLGVGSGYLRYEYEGFGLSFDEKRQRFDEALPLLRTLWTGRAPERLTGYYPGPAVSLNVRPLQRPLPPLWLAIVRAEAVRPAARKGYPIMVIPYAVTLTDDDLDLFTRAFRSTYAGPEARPPGLAAAYHAFVAPTTQEAHARVLPYLDRYIESRTQHIGGSAEDILRGELAIVGDPATCVDRIRRLEACGVDHLLLIMSFGRLPDELVRSSMSLMVSEVMPAFAPSRTAVASA
jgi:alkanesulfonate monooxygenase SsuD/methylene tetrahydromethanopterin reductase-like flavin-dependent oxidoreductase (luciferase family)